MNLKYVKFKDDYLAHYGVKGMRWGHRNGSASKEFLEEKAYNSRKNNFKEGFNVAKDLQEQNRNRNQRAMSDIYGGMFEDMEKALNAPNATIEDNEKIARDYIANSINRGAASVRKYEKFRWNSIIATGKAIVSTGMRFIKNLFKR